MWEKILTPFRKVRYIFQEMWYMIRKEKVYFIAPLLLVLALLAVFVYYIGHSVIVTFIYAGL